MTSTIPLPLPLPLSLPAAWVRPLVVQFCAKTPEDFLQAALQVQEWL